MTIDEAERTAPTGPTGPTGPTVRLGFLPASFAIADPDHPGLFRASPEASAPYARDRIEHHGCPAVDLSAATAETNGSPSTRSGGPSLAESGFDTVDLRAFAPLQDVLARVLAAGHITDDDGAAIRALLDGAVLGAAHGPDLTVLHVAEEGLIMRTAGPNGMSVFETASGEPVSQGMNGHGPATSVHADQDVYGTPLTQLMAGRAPELFRHDSPDGANHDADLMLVNMWIPLHQITQPLVLADGGSIDRRRHQLRYALPTESFLDRDDDMVTNDIWTFLHHPTQRWFLHSAMDHRSAYVFNTLSTPHGSCALPGEAVAETLYRTLCAAETAVGRGDVDGLRAALAEPGDDIPPDTPPALRAAIVTMVETADRARRDLATTCGADATAWLTAARDARRPLVRMSVELRMVVSVAA